MKMQFYGKAVDRVFGVVLIALLSSLILLAGSLLVNVNDQVLKDEAALAAGTRLQMQTFYTFDRGAMWGYKLAQKQLISVIQELVQESIKLHDQKNVKAHRKFHKIK